MPRWESVPVRIRDIAGDGADEIFIAHAPKGSGNGTASGLLICYSYDGEELWRFESGGVTHQLREAGLSELGVIEVIRPGS